MPDHTRRNSVLQRAENRAASLGGEGDMRADFYCVQSAGLVAFAVEFHDRDGGSRMQDRRADPRAEVELDLQYQSVQEFLAAYTRNISGGGVFVQSPDPQPLNQKVLLRFSLPGIDRKFEVHGMVVWVNTAATRSSFPSGMGIKFLDLEPEEQKLITDFVNQTPKGSGGGTGGAGGPSLPV
jgi:uncharacterized protein (TIGR02266 family)